MRLFVGGFQMSQETVGAESEPGASPAMAQVPV